jgi:hypothetical protein
MSTDIHSEMIKAVSGAHRDAQEKVKKARQATRLAIRARRKVSVLVEKSKRLHLQDLNGFLGDVLAPDQIKDYLFLSAVASKRKDALADKSQLQRMGLLTRQPARKPRVTPPPSLMRSSAKAAGMIKKTVEKLGGVYVPKGQADTVAHVLKPLAEIYLAMDRQAKAESK